MSKDSAKKASKEKPEKKSSASASSGATQSSKPGKSLKEISKKMRHLDLCMMTTIATGGMIESRPMSNNGDVAYDGNSYFFTWDKSRLVKDLEKNADVNLSFQAKAQLFISVSGKAVLVRERAPMEAHWVPDLEKWFEDGLDTKGLVMIHVKAKRIKYWQKEEEGEVALK